MSSLEKMAAIGQLLHTQDDQMTGDPQFLVQRKERLYGFDPQYDGDYVWLHADEYDEVDEEKHAILERYYSIYSQEPDNYRKVYYQDRWEYVQAFFTEAAALAFIKRNAHRYGEKRVYVDCGFRNPEWQDIRDYLMSLTSQPSQP